DCVAGRPDVVQYDRLVSRLAEPRLVRSRPALARADAESVQRVRAVHGILERAILDNHRGADSSRPPGLIAHLEDDRWARGADTGIHPPLDTHRVFGNGEAVREPA